MDNAARGDTTKSDPCYAPDIIVDFQKAVKAVDVLASHLLDEGVNEAERAFYEHVYSYYGSSALQQHAAQCPGDWAGSYASETERTGDLTWDAWAAVSKAATCRKWQTDVFPELAKQVKAAGKEIREYFNWALQLCYREDAVNDGCPVDKPVGAHLAKTVHKVTPEVKEFFVKLGAAAAPPSKPKVLADAAAAVQPLQRPAALPEGGAARVQELFHGSPEGGSKGAAGAPVPKSAAIVSLAQPLLAAAAAGDYAKWHALVSNATAQDKASYRAWSKQLKKLDAGGDKKETKDAVAKHVATGMSWWVETWAQPDRKEGGLQSIAGRAALARKKVAATLAKDFFAPAGSPARAKARGETSAAALAWLEKEADARKQAFAAGGGPAPDCSWFPKAGTVPRAQSWISHVRQLANGCVFANQPLATCMPTPELISAACKALGKSAKPAAEKK